MLSPCGWPSRTSTTKVFKSPDEMPQTSFVNGDLMCISAARAGGEGGGGGVVGGGQTEVYFDMSLLKLGMRANFDAETSNISPPPPYPRLQFRHLIVLRRNERGVTTRINRSLSVK